MKKVLLAASILLALTVNARSQTLTVVNDLDCPIMFSANATGTSSCYTSAPATITFFVASHSSLTLNMATMPPSQWTSYPGSSGYWINWLGGDACGHGTSVTDPCLSPFQIRTWTYNCTGSCYNYTATATWTGSGATAATVTIN